MKRFLRAVVVAALALPAASVGAQGPGPGGGPPPPPQLRAKFQAWRTWRAKHPNVMGLQRTLRGLDGLERDPKMRLNKKQAGTVLAVINKWRTRPTLTDAQARQATQQIKAALTPAQTKRLATAFPGPPPGGGFGGPPPGGFGGGPGGGPPPGGFRGPPPGGGPPPPGGFGGPPPGGRRGPPPGGFRGPPPVAPNAADFPNPKDYNPLNPSTLPFKREAPRARQRLAALMTSLSRTK